VLTVKDHYVSISLKPLCRAVLRVDSQLRAGDRRNGGQPVRTTALVQLGRDGQVEVAACIGGSKQTALIQTPSVER